MKIATGLPNTHRGVSGSLLVEWARRADVLGYSALGTIGRITYDNHEELTTLAAAAAVTTRIELMTTVLLGPARDAALLGKQAATVQSLSVGRFRLGLGIGQREDDFRACAADFQGRARSLEEQVALFRQMEQREPIRGTQDPIGPYRPFPIILSGRAEKAVERAGRIADGFLSTPGAPQEISNNFEIVRRAWGDRPGTPYLGGSAYFVLGDVAAGEEHVRDYYGFAGPQFVDLILSSLCRTPDDIRKTIAALQETGAQEIFLWPVSSELSELDRLAAVVF